MTDASIPLLCLHGAGGTSNVWRKTTPYIGAPHALVDLPGRSGIPPEPDIESHAAWLAGRLPEQGAVLAGHSMGGLIALETAARSDRVLGVLLAASHTELPVHEKVLDKLRGGTYPDGLFYASYSDKLDPDVLAEEKEALTLVDTPQQYADFAACSEYRGGREALEKLRVPVRAVYGEEDRLLPPGAQEALGVPSTTIPGCGHFIMVEKPEALAEEINQFYTKITGGKTS
ncbi:alpha/beta fold hydrolase [Alkalicoccus urumqiensis]|uniref:AB hydrolase-1 domain-containing protein n=1 Tax=Alkalicoccus urumqiensis TaxID=1548213 RepID=A0A2P6MLU2_ALKUR|nr:alpha/beta hydrolase [Alkalicoccus urumqiensis]PRO67243.1 hypothetical protein C6I21_01390 [Alkalicoccus urumqiensis]